MTEAELEAIEERVKFYQHEVLDMWDSDEVLGYITSLMADNGRQHNEIIHLKVQLRQAQEAAREEGIMEERHRCLADMCWMCKANRGVRQVNFEGAPTWIHPEKGHSYGSPCGAQQIRRRWSQESTS